MKTKLRISLFFVLAGVLFAACSGRTPLAEDEKSPDAVVGDLATFIEIAQEGGSSVEASGEIIQPFFDPPGQVVVIDGFELQVFEFPDEAFKMRWQYSELLKRYSKVLHNITGSLQSVMMIVKSYGV